MYQGYRRQGFSPIMGIIGLFLLLFLFTKGFWVLPVIFLVGMFMWGRGQHFHRFDGCGWGEHEKRKIDAFDKRKRDEFFDEYKRKNDDGDDVYYV